MTLEPQRPFIIVWDGADPNDTDTLYVQSVVKDATTLSTLATVNLTDQGSQLFTKSYTTPPDTSQTGQGRQIIITTTVYTDSGYTTKSSNYSRITAHYIVKKLLNADMVFGSGGSSIDEETLKKIIAKEIAILEEKLVKTEPLKLPEYTPPDLSPVFSAIQTLSEKVDTIKIPEPKKIEIPETDLTPIHSTIRNGIEKVLRKINLLSTIPDYTSAIPQFEKLLDTQKELDEKIKEDMENSKTILEQYKNMLSFLDEKTIALLGVLEYLKGQNMRNESERNAIADSINTVNRVRKTYIPYKS